jgi:DnaK suppressor protein
MWPKRRILDKLWRRPCSMDAAEGQRYKAAAPEGGRSAVMASTMTKEYRPSDDEPFMNDRQLDYFRRKLIAWKDEILEESRTTIATLQQETVNEADLADRATSEADRALELRTRDRQRKLISKIEEALRRIEDGSYGYCEETGEPISLSRLEARPIATLSLEAQERHERRERVHRDD